MTSDQIGANSALPILGILLLPACRGDFASAIRPTERLTSLVPGKPGGPDPATPAPHPNQPLTPVTVLTVHWSLATGHWSLATGPWSLVTSTWLGIRLEGGVDGGDQLLIVERLLQEIRCATVQGPDTGIGVVVSRNEDDRHGGTQGREFGL